jgi:hypothetical protein
LHPTYGREKHVGQNMLLWNPKLFLSHVNYNSFKKMHMLIALKTSVQVLL